MKKLISMLAVMAFAPLAIASHHGDHDHHGDHAKHHKHKNVDSEMSADGEFRLRFNWDNKLAFKDERSRNQWHQRAKLGHTFRMGDQFSTRVVFLHNAQWGNDEGDAKQTNDISVNGSEVLNGLSVNNAYASWMWSDSLMVKVGRMPVHWNNGTVFAHNDWQEVPFSFDGAKIGWDPAFGTIAFYGLKLVDHDNFGNSNTDKEDNLYALTYDFKNLPEVVQDIHVHVISRARNNKDNTVTDDSLEDLRFGVGLGGLIAGVDWRVSAAFQDSTAEDDSGAETDTEAFMVDTEVGYHIRPFLNSRAWVGFHLDTGNDESNDENERYDPLFYERHYNAGLMDIVNWGNLTYITVGYEVRPTDRLKAGIVWHNFSASEDTMNSTVSLNNGLGMILSDGEDDIGNEIDIYANHEYGENFDVTGRVGLFSPGDMFASPDDETQLQLYAQARWHF